MGGFLFDFMFIWNLSFVYKDKINIGFVKKLTVTWFSFLTPFLVCVWDGALCSWHFANPIWNI